jgi:formylmethanofuran dehydrogenase subunit D
MKCSDKMENKTYWGECKIIKDTFNELSDDCILEFPEGLMESLGWKDGDEVNLDVKMSTHGNVLVISKEKT